MIITIFSCTIQVEEVNRARENNRLYHSVPILVLLTPPPNLRVSFIGHLVTTFSGMSHFLYPSYLFSTLSLSFSHTLNIIAASNHQLVLVKSSGHKS